MRFELIIFFVAGFIIANIYTDGKYMKLVLSWKKYYQMAGVAFGAFVLYWLVRKNPNHAKNIIMASNEYVKYLPVDKNTTDMISPLLDFTSKSLPGKYENQYEERILQSGGDGKTKRSVSETKKKFVASRQEWKCGDCKILLPAWFEIDHIKRLEHGGSNHVDNLLALCRDCHGKKTAIENL